MKAGWRTQEDTGRQHCWSKDHSEQLIFIFQLLLAGWTWSLLPPPSCSQDRNDKIVWPEYFPENAEIMTDLADDNKYDQDKVVCLTHNLNFNVYKFLVMNKLSRDFTNILEVGREKIRVRASRTPHQ